MEGENCQLADSFLQYNLLYFLLFWKNMLSEFQSIHKFQIVTIRIGILLNESVKTENVIFFNSY
jgi:hypothetical protein